MTTILKYNFTSNNVPGAYYGTLPELPLAQLSVPNGTIDFTFNSTEQDIEAVDARNGSRYDYMYTVYFNRPDPESVYLSPSGYQFQESIFFGNFLGPAENVTFSASDGPIYWNDTLYIFAPGDSFVAQLIELEEDGSTPTGNRFFGPNITIVRNETLPITTTLVLSEENSKLVGTNTAIISTSSRAPPATTYPWTAEPATTTAAAASGGQSSPAQTSAPANAGSRSTKGSSLLQIGTALLLISAAVGAF